jgi:hypothetical protein
MSPNPSPKQEEQQNPWETYEKRKADLPDGLSDREYQEACRKIAEELGI